MPKIQSTTKICAKCESGKSLDNFHVRSESGDGRASRCKACTVEDKRVYRSRHTDSSKAYRRRYDKAHPDKKAARKQRYMENHPEKIRAHNQVYIALKSGTIIKPQSCSGCGAIGYIEAHHPDYTKPLSVEWLCRECHRSRHST